MFKLDRGTFALIKPKPVAAFIKLVFKLRDISCLASVIKHLWASVGVFSNRRTILVPLFQIYVIFNLWIAKLHRFFKISIRVEGYNRLWMGCGDPIRFFIYHNSKFHTFFISPFIDPTAMIVYKRLFIFL